MSNNFDFFDDDRYATDCGPRCPAPGCVTSDDDTLWVYTCQWPYRMVVGTSACCHAHLHFELYSQECSSPADCTDASGKPTIRGIKSAHYRYRDSLANLPATPLVERGTPSDTTCEIKWVDAHGNPTADNNPMVGYCYRENYYEPATERCPTTIHYPQTPYYRICAAHKEHMSSILLPHWRFVEKL